MKEERIITGFAVFFLVGIILHSVPSLSFIPGYITDAFLFAANIIVFLHIRRGNRSVLFLVFFFSAFLFTYLAEVLGVFTGKIFGVYQYGLTLKVQLLQVPLIIPFNWVMLVLGMTSIVQAFRLPRMLIPPIAALGLTIFDFTMEPVAIRLDYWSWQGPGIPLQNYLAWFSIALLISSGSVLFRFRLENRLLRSYVIIQWVFFLVLNVFFHYF